jgi:hypothetical protein
MVDALQQALRGAEEQNTRMQDRSDVAALCFLFGVIGILELSIDFLIDSF